MDTIPLGADTAYQLAAGYLHTRLLYPFFLQRRCSEQAIEALVTLRCQEDRPVWHGAAPHLYCLGGRGSSIQHLGPQTLAT
jgi:hypothetical protein